MPARFPVLPIAVTLVVLAAMTIGALIVFQVPAILGQPVIRVTPGPLAVPTSTIQPTNARAGVVAIGPSVAAPARPSPSPAVGPSSSPAVGPSSSVAPPAANQPSSSVGPIPSATPRRSPSLVPAPLTGVLVPPNVAARHVIAVMIDDLSPARPQSGFSSAAVVWQAPAEGGIPRYMLLFQDAAPADVGPVRSARYYFIGWAAEWRAAYAHAGGSSQALRALRSQGRGQLVYNIDQFAFSSTYFWRIGTRRAPHNLYTNGRRLQQLANSAGAGSTATPPKPAWTFRSEIALEDRPTGGAIEAWYYANHIRYTYDRATNTYPRWVSPGVRQIDASTGRRVAPRNVVIMFVRFGALNDSHPEKGRLEAEFIGSGPAYVATNGRTVVARWVKPLLTAPTRFVTTTGGPIALTPGQTFIQVMPAGSHVRIVDGTPPLRRSSAGHSARPE